MSRVGLGFDAHRFDASRALVLGGVTFPDSPGLSGHSDGDALCHAIGDALLGAAGLGDLGAIFPPTPRWRDAPGVDILRGCAAALRDAGARITSVDATVIAEVPRVAPHRDEMIAAIAGALDIPITAVSVKATTTDGMGFTGRGEGIAAIAVALVEP